MGWVVPVAGACIGLAWFPSGFTCPRKLNLDIRGGIAFSDVIVSVNFAGRGVVSSDCGGSDTYVTFTRLDTDRVLVAIDVWAAYRAGVWTSSTTVVIYTKSNSPDSSDRCDFNPTAGSKVSAFPFGTACPATSWATITVNDDGTLSIT